MTRVVLLSALAAVSAAGCAHGRIPDRADIELVSVTVAPTKLDGRAWDDVRLADALLVIATPSVATIASVDPLRPGLVLLAELLRKELSASSLPDPFGTATLVSDEGPRVVKLAKQSNTCEPQFLAEWRDVKLARSTSIRLELRDADVLRADALGTVELTYDDLATAARAGELTSIAVSDRDRRLRDVGLRVREAAEK
jgi:hypothetical protein